MANIRSLFIQIERNTEWKHSRIIWVLVTAGDTNLIFLLAVSDSVKKMTAGTVTRPPPSPPPSICSRRREMVATEMSLVLEEVLAARPFCQRADCRVIPLSCVWVSAWTVCSVVVLALQANITSVKDFYSKYCLCF